MTRIHYTSPSWIAVDRTGAVYVTDSANHRIKKFDPTGRALIAWGSEGHSPGRFTNPQGIAIGSDGLIYVVDGNPNNRVQIFTPAGVLAGVWWPLANWWENENHAQIYAANGIAARADGQIAIADYGAGEIELLAASGGAVTPVPLPPSNHAQSQDVTPSTTLRQVPTERDWMVAASAWLSGSPCQAPCWEGITPLATSEGLHWYTLSLIYPQQGTILLEYGRVAPLLADTWQPPVVIFSDQPLVDGLFGHESTHHTLWQGLQPFAFYCRDERGTPCEPAQSR